MSGPMPLLSPPLRAGVLGAGSMGANHARAYDLLGGASFVGVYDPAEECARSVVERYGGRVFPSAAALLEAVDVVTIASPSYLHLEHALLALEHGCDVLIEKPVAMRTCDAEHLLQAVAHDPRGPVIAAGHVEHFNPAVRELRKLLIGRQVIGLDCRRLGPASDRNRDIDVVQDLMLHDLHIVLDLLGSAPVNVHGFGTAMQPGAVVDYAVATIAFESGTIATFGASRATEERVRRMSITARDTHITVDLAARTLEACRSTNLESIANAGVRQQCVVERIHVPSAEPLLLQTGDFLDACARRRPPAVGLDMAIRCLELVDAVRETVAEPSAQTLLLAS